MKSHPNPVFYDSWPQPRASECLSDTVSSYQEQIILQAHDRAARQSRAERITAICPATDIADPEATAYTMPTMLAGIER